MHIEKLPSGAWRAVVKINGQRRTVTRPTKAEARYAGAEVLIELGGRPNERTVTVAELIHGHLAEVKDVWSPTTHQDTTRVARALPDTFLERRVCDVTPAVLHVLYHSLARDGWSVHRIRRAHMLMSVAWRTAVIYKWANSNPCRDVKPPTPTRAQVQAPEHEQVAAILAASTGLFRLYVQVAANTGARRGEVVALRWEDFDLGESPAERASVAITHSNVDAYGEITERATKTGDKGHRRLVLDLPTATALRRWRTTQAAMALASGMETPCWVFSENDAGGTPWRPDRVSREFARACHRAGVTGVRLHDLRHYVATTMLEDGEEMIDVSAQLGHASMATTASVYAHYRTARGADSADRRAARLYGDSNG
jgi:integrase